MQVVLGCRPDKAPEDFRSTVMKLFQDCGPMIAGGADNNTGEFHPGFLHEWNDLRHVSRPSELVLVSYWSEAATSVLLTVIILADLR